MAPNFKKAGKVSVLIAAAGATVAGGSALAKKHGMSVVNKLSGALSARRNAGSSKPTAVQDVPMDDESGPDNRHQA